MTRGLTLTLAFYLTEATGRLGIRQVSPKGQSNARWMPT